MRNLYPSDDAPEYYQAVKDAIADAKKLTSEDVRFPIQKRSGEIDTKMVKILQEKNNKGFKNKADSQKCRQT